ncbi:MAG TPA: M20/M25/M40 family metallo-hydrolase [Pseudomonadales bacterium]
MKFSANLLLCLAAACCALARAGEVDVIPAPDPQADAEVTAVLASERVRAGLEHIVELEERSLADLIELTEIPAPPFGERNRAERFAQLLVEAGLAEVAIDEVGNVIGRRPGRSGERTVAYSAHLDTVFPEGTDVTVRVDGARLHAPGVGDNSRGLVTVLAVLRAMEHAGIETDADVLFIGNVGEEGLGDLRGMKHLFRDGGPRIDTLIAVDGGRSDRIVFGGVGSHRYRVVVRGPGGHSWGAFGTANPLHALGRAISLFVEEAAVVTAEGDKSSFNIGRVGGGTSVNSVPFEAWAEVDIRSGDPAKIAEIDSIFHSAVSRALEAENSLRSEGDALTAEVVSVGRRPAADGDPDVRVVRLAVAATRAFGVDPRLRLSSTDANLPLSRGIPAVTLSRGGVSGNSHAPTEWWENVDGHVAMQIGLLTVIAEAGLVR